MSSSIFDDPSFKQINDLNLLSAAYDYRNAASPCDHNTRQNVIHDILDWANGNGEGGLHRICWLRGHAGLGKSAIAHTIAKRLDDDFPKEDERKLVGTFVFSRNDEVRRNKDRIFPTLAYQLAKRITSTQRRMLGALQENRDIPTSRLETQFQRLFLDPIEGIASSSAPGRFIVVIDGLDECHEEDVVAFINVLAQHGSALPVRFLLASRNEPHIRAAIQGLVETTRIFDLHDWGYEAMDDIRTFLWNRLSALVKENRDSMRKVKKPWPDEETVERIIEKSQGVFQYVSTLVQHVSKPPGEPDKKLTQAAEGHPGLYSLYEQVLGDAPNRAKPDFGRIFGALLVLRYPISINALAYLLGFSSSELTDKLDGCGSILSIPTDDGGVINDEEAIGFYHASLPDFFKSEMSSSGKVPNKFFIDSIQHHVYMLKHCIRVITQGFKSISGNKNGESTNEVHATSGDTDKDEESTTGSRENNEDDDGQGNAEAVSYALENWQYHMMDLIQADKELVDRPLNLDLVQELPEFLARVGDGTLKVFGFPGERIRLDENQLVAVALGVKDDRHDPELFKLLCTILKKLEEADLLDEDIREELDLIRLEEEILRLEEIFILIDENLETLFDEVINLEDLFDEKFTKLRVRHTFQFLVPDVLSYLLFQWKIRWARLGVFKREESPSLFLEDIASLWPATPSEPGTPFESTPKELQPATYQLATWHPPLPSQNLPTYRWLRHICPYFGSARY